MTTARTRTFSRSRVTASGTNAFEPIVFFQGSRLGIWAHSIERLADNHETALDKPVGEPSDRNVRRRVSIQYAWAAASVKGLRREAPEG
jgi:hypothetical protein